MSIKMTVHAIEAEGTDSLSGKTGEVLIVSFDDLTVTESPPFSVLTRYARS